MFQNDVSVAVIVDAISNEVASHFYGIHHFEIKRYPRNLLIYQDDVADQFLQHQ